jgi:hypothetical protein
VYLGYTQGHVATTDATVTTVCRYFPLATLNNAHSGFLKIYVTGCRTGGSSGSTGDSVGAEITALVYQVYSGSVCTIVQQNTTLMKSNANCNVSITTSSQYLVVQVTGDTNNNYDWSCTIVHNTVG